MVKAKKYVYKNHFVGEPKRTDVEIVEEDLPPLKDDEFLCEAVYLSVDPYMRPYMNRFGTGITMIGSQVAKIVESRNAKYPVGKHVLANFGWRTRTISNGRAVGRDAVTILPDYGPLPLSLGLGILGMPGMTAYFGFLEICQPKPGETVVVSGAAGAVGSVVGQIAKIKGCTVIGLAGSDVKCEWLRTLGFDHAINYKTQSILDELKRVATKGVDCYFDNVGGETSAIVLSLMNERGRISVCGSISAYNADWADLKNAPRAPVVQPTMIFKELKMEGFVVTNRWLDRYPEGIKQHVTWLKENKLKYRETITRGFDNMFDAFVGMLKGENIGKAIVQV